MFLKSTLPPRKSKYRSQSQIMPWSQKRSHRNSVQNGPIERFTALTRTTFMTIPMFISRRQKIDPDPWNLIVTKLFAPKFCAEWSDRELHSSHGDHFRDHFHVYVSGPVSSNLQTTYGQLLANLWGILGQPKWPIRNVSKKRDPEISYFCWTFWEFRFLPYDFLSTDIRCSTGHPKAGKNSSGHIEVEEMPKEFYFEFEVAEVRAKRHIG